MDHTQLKSQLLDLITAEKEVFKSSLAHYYSKQNPTQNEYLALNQALITSLTRIFSFYHEHHGEHSLFLRSTIKPLKKALERAKEIREQLEVTEHSALDAGAYREIPDDKELVYIVLYQSKGHDLSQWEQQLKVLNQIIQSRPVYRTEEEAAKAIRSRGAIHSEAYISVVVPKQAIIKQEGFIPRQDKEGRHLLNLAEGAIEGEKAIMDFVLAGRRYGFISGKLILKERANPPLF